MEIVIGTATGVSATAVRQDTQTRGERVIELTVTNDRGTPVRYEAELDEGTGIVNSSSELIKRNGQPVWKATIPANGSARLRYRVRPRS